MSDRWIVFDPAGDYILGRVTGARTRDFALLCARALFPELPVMVKGWDNASKEERATSKRRKLVRPEMAAKLIPHDTVFPNKLPRP